MKQPRIQRPSINGRLVVLLSAVIILILMLASPVRDLVAQRAKIEALKIQIAQSEKQVQMLKDVQVKWQDPNFVAAQARARLHYVLPGEIVFNVIGLDGNPQPVTSAPSVSAWSGDLIPAQPWYLNLYDSWLEADTGVKKYDANEKLIIRPNAPK